MSDPVMDAVVQAGVVDVLEVMGLKVPEPEIALIAKVVEGVIAALGQNAADKAHKAGIDAAAKITNAAEAEKAASERT